MILNDIKSPILKLIPSPSSSKEVGSSTWTFTKSQIKSLRSVSLGEIAFEIVATLIYIPTRVYNYRTEEKFLRTNNVLN